MEWLADLALMLIVAGIVGVGTIATLLGIFYLGNWHE